ITCTDSFAKAVCLAASTIAERASDFFFHAGLPTVMGEASSKSVFFAKNNYVSDVQKIHREQVYWNYNAEFKCKNGFKF
ncbi:MAG: hypothetical protein SPL62_02705, partial [Selenomonas sp.]|nr:hypothetical protein [Selenomonas sp.]